MALASTAALAAESAHLRVRYLGDASCAERGDSAGMIDVLLFHGSPALKSVLSAHRRRLFAGGEGVCVLPPGTPYGIEAGGPRELLSLSLDPELVRPYLRSDVSLAFDEDRVAAADPFLQQIGTALRCGMRLGCPPTVAYLEALAAPIARHLANSYGRVTAQRDGALAPYRLHRVRTYVAAHCGQALGLEALADAAGLSSFHFARTFRQATGETPHVYVTRMRIEEAKRLLAETELPLEEIAVRVGYRTHSHFSSAFRRVAGKTPTQYRRR